jgi:TPP-dependent pyruvate/acetoin dehydrogenase alpha subunit
MNSQEVDKGIKAEVDEATEFAKAAPLPELSETYKDVYSPSTGPYFARATELSQSVVVNP